MHRRGFSVAAIVSPKSAGDDALPSGQTIWGLTRRLTVHVGRGPEASGFAFRRRPPVPAAARREVERGLHPLARAGEAA